MVKVGFIGCGRHATKMLYPSLHLARMELVAVCDKDEKRARRNAKWFGAERVYSNHIQMLERESLEAVLICTTPNTHAPLTLDCIKYGVPVYVEKPPAMTLGDAEYLRERSEETGVKVMVGTMKRHALVYRQMKAIISSPEFGQINAVQSKICVGHKNGNGFSLLLDLGIHLIDLLHFLIGEISDVSYRKVEYEGTHISYALLVSFVSGAVGSVFISNQHLWTRPNERIEITGEGQYVVADNLLQLEHYKPNGEINTWKPGFSIPNDENLSQFIGGYAGALQEFGGAICHNFTPHPNMSDACAAMRIINKIEPKEVYEKGPQSYPHWKSEEFWFG